MSTLAASYLAKMRGSGEPEASAGRCKDLENFQRELNAYILDHGHLVGDKYDEPVARFRARFEEIMVTKGGKDTRVGGTKGSFGTSRESGVGPARGVLYPQPQEIGGGGGMSMGFAGVPSGGLSVIGQPQMTVTQQMGQPRQMSYASYNVHE